MEKEQDKDIIIPKEIEFNIELKLDDVAWIRCLEFLIQSLCVPKEYWE
jgi:hypothetical protein